MKKKTTIVTGSALTEYVVKGEIARLKEDDGEAPMFALKEVVLWNLQRPKMKKDNWAAGM